MAFWVARPNMKRNKLLARAWRVWRVDCQSEPYIHCGEAVEDTGSILVLFVLRDTAIDLHQKWYEHRC